MVVSEFHGNSEWLYFCSMMDDGATIRLPVVWAAMLGLTALAALLVRAMIWGGAVDRPAGRKAHARPTPTSGGVGVMGACVAALALFPVLRAPTALPALAAALALGLVGWADDRRDRGVAVKLGAQVLAATLAVGAGPGLVPEWGLAGAVLAALWLIFITNMFNFMDGLDGLAGGTGLVAALFLALAAPPGGMTQLAALALAAGLAGFLPFNLAPARIFMGDAGSQFCGFYLGVLGLALLPMGSPDPAPPFWVPLFLLPMLLGGMLVDVVLTLIRRAWAGRRITEAHREHFYQRRVLPDAWVAALHWGFACCGGLAWLLLDQGHPWPATALIILPQLAWLATVRRHPPIAPHKATTPDSLRIPGP